jgi:phosphoesterase RecJ-like protein
MIDRIIDIINSNKTFLIASHIRLDGDALGSELALYHALRDMGKNVSIYNRDATPELYTFLPGSDEIIHRLDSVNDFDAAFLLDCSDIERVGEEAGLIESLQTVINIDHHISNDYFSEISLVDVDASSTGEILYRILEKLGVIITKDIAVNLYTAVLTDTGAFRYSNTGRGTFAVAAKLVEAGADPRGIAERIYETKPIAQIRLLGEALKTLEIEEHTETGSIVISQHMLRDTGALPEYTEGFVDIIRSISDIEVAVLFHEMSEHYYKVSLRSKGKADVEKIARAFGGGGHINASACRMSGDLETVKKTLLDRIRETCV